MNIKNEDTISVKKDVVNNGKMMVINNAKSGISNRIVNILLLEALNGTKQHDIISSKVINRKYAHKRNKNKAGELGTHHLILTVRKDINL